MRVSLSAILQVIRRVAGMPDYAVYLEHLHSHHPEHPVPTERDFYDWYLKNRYGDAPTRCC
ncbi:MAG: YbdD/YjiX family protein [Gemmatimonadales bacterium]